MFDKPAYRFIGPKPTHMNSKQMYNISEKFPDTHLTVFFLIDKNIKINVLINVSKNIYVSGFARCIKLNV